MKGIFTIVILLFSFLSNAQVKFIRKADTTSTEQSPLAPFYFLEKNIDTNKMLFLGEINVFSKKPGHTIEILYYRLKREAQKIGANAFLLRSYKEENAMMSFTASVYLAGDSSIVENIGLKQKNCVYVFSFGDNKAEITLFTNGQEKKIKQYSGSQVCLNDNETLELKRYDGTKIEFKGNSKTTNVYINLQETEKYRPMTNVYYVSGAKQFYSLSMTKTTGFYQMNPEFGRLLQEIYFSK